MLGRRTDGYHELHTVFQTVTLHDDLLFTASADARLQLSCDQPDIPIDESNLIHRAAAALRLRYNVERGASIHLRKMIPVKGGLGGGSSDAAAALLGLAHLWRVETHLDELEELAASLGADVPFFLTGGTALGTGLGTKIKPLPDVAARPLIIVRPDAEVSTAEAYKALNAPALTKLEGDTILFSSRRDEQFPDSLPDELHNDFERVIFRLHPEILRAKESLLRAGARGALLAGSGASVFGIFDNTEAQERAAAALSAEAGWRVFACAPLARADYMRALGAQAAILRASSSVNFDIGA